MPSYNANPVRALYPGGWIALVDNAASDSGVATTQQFAAGPNPVNISNVINFVNTTNQDAQGQIAWADVDGDYANASGLIVAAGTSLPYNLAGGWVRFTFATAPTSGSLIALR